MGRFAAGLNQLGFLYESGTFANPTGLNLQWIGLVQDHTFGETPNVMPTRYLGTGSSTVSQFIDGPLDFAGTITFFPQDWKFLAFALGSCVDAGSPTPYSHTISHVESNMGYAYTSGATISNPPSFNLQDAQQFNPTGTNFIRNAVGCVIDSFTISAAQGEIITCEANYIAQNVTFASGDPSGLTETTTRPFIWSDVRLHIPSGTEWAELLDFSFTINNNMLAPHYLNGSRQVGIPIPQGKDYELAITLHAESAVTRTKALYETYFLGGSVFNAMLEIRAGAAGARDCFIPMSGCKITAMDAPSAMEGINEQSITINPKNVGSVLINDSTLNYNPW